MLCYYIVSGEANFSMKYTGLTVGGFIQPSVARGLIELHGNADKGFSQRFLWCVPRPRFVRFTELQAVDTDFSASIGNNCVNSCKHVLTTMIIICLCMWHYTKPIYKA